LNLIEQIQAAQVKAAERVVLQHLKDLGINDTLNDTPNDLAAQRWMLEAFHTLDQAHRTIDTIVPESELEAQSLTQLLQKIKNLCARAPALVK
jgi:hypothetical protein